MAHAVSTLNEPEMGEGPVGEPPKKASLIMSSYGLAPVYLALLARA